MMAREVALIEPEDGVALRIIGQTTAIHERKGLKVTALQSD